MYTHNFFQHLVDFMEDNKEINPGMPEARTLIGAIVAFGKDVFTSFRSYLDTESYLPSLGSSPPEKQSPKTQLGSSEFGRRVRGNNRPEPNLRPPPRISNRRNV